ncbi:hypothetical protein [Lederbergia citri]|nr:hypothetical protein [Lederbergia citri]
MKKNSAKIGHFLAIVEVYKEIRRLGQLDTFLVEPKYGDKGKVEPDIYCEYRKTPFFIEVQKTVYSERQMSDKMARYIALYNDGILKPFPRVLILSEQRYAIDAKYPMKVFQAQTFSGFIGSLNKDQRPIEKGNAGIKVKIG